MTRSTRRILLGLAFAATTASVAVPLLAQRGAAMPQEQRDVRWEREKELQSLAVVERKVMMPMRDGVRLATDIYRPKNAAGKVPIVFVKTPYNFNYWDVRNGVPADMTAALTAIKRGYAYVVQNERGHFFSEGHYDILGPPATDGYDAMEWLSKQHWSNGKIGATGCSSTAEYQPAVAAQGHPAFAAMNVQGFGAGVGRVGPYYEQGNWYRGGAVQMLFITWISGQQNQVRPMFPKDTPQADLVQAARLFDLAPQNPPVDWGQALEHLPVQDIIENVNGPRGIFADEMPVATGGRMIQRTPNDPAWYKGGLWHDDMKLELPGLWQMSWYDVSAGPNIEMFNHVQRTAPKAIADQQWMIIAPVAQCALTRSTENTVVGERRMGDARLDYAEIMYGFFDKFLKGESNTRVDTLPKVTYFTMGSNKWQSADRWPPAGAQPMTFYLTSGGTANTLKGDGTRTPAPPWSDVPKAVTYEPMIPDRSLGGHG
jgi:putative CocE/NonD family hydrolase